LSTFSTFSAIPRQSDPFIRQIVPHLPKDTPETHGYLGDFWTWESSFYLALRSGKAQNDVYLVDGAANGVVYEVELEDFLQKHQQLTYFSVCHSKLTPYVEQIGDTMRFKVLGSQFDYFAKCSYNRDGIRVFELAQKSFSGANRSGNCPEPNSAGVYRMRIRQDLTWFTDVKVKAARNGITLNKMLDREAEWLVNNP
jgi:hypothetical protein